MTRSKLSKDLQIEGGVVVSCTRLQLCSRFFVKFRINDMMSSRLNMEREDRKTRLEALV